MIDLAARWLGGGVVSASDESFGFKENLLVTAPAAFEPGHYDHRGEIVDGWETRRRRSGTHDWVVVRLGAPGVIAEVDVDTSFFTGNYPTTCRLETVCLPGHPSAAELEAAGWTELLGHTALKGDTHNVLAVDDPRRWTHVRLEAHPDGGIARLRVRGEVVPDPALWEGVTVELSGAREGATVLSSSDDFYSSAEVLIRPDTPATMGEGWETARRRDGGHDSVVVRLAAPGTLQRVEVDTTHYKYNASAAVELWGSSDGGAWEPLLPLTPLQPDTRHVFVVDTAEAAFVRLDAHPDGGLARLRLWGRPTEAGLAAARARWAATA